VPSTAGPRAARWCVQGCSPAPCALWYIAVMWARFDSEPWRYGETSGRATRVVKIAKSVVGAGRRFRDDRHVDMARVRVLFKTPTKNSGIVGMLHLDRWLTRGDLHSRCAGEYTRLARTTTRSPIVSRSNPPPRHRHRGPANPAQHAANPAHDRHLGRMSRALRGWFFPDGDHCLRPTPRTP